MRAPKIVNLDPYDIPAHLIPPGMMYQWVAKKSLGENDPHWQAMLDAGWAVVPYHRLMAHYRGRHQMDDGSGGILIGGQALMERTRDASKIARDKEIDKASVNASASRNIAIDLVSEFNLSAHEIATAQSMKLSSGQYAAWRVKMIAEGRDASIIVGGVGEKLMFGSQPAQRVAKFKWIGWLFDLISTATPKDDDNV